MKITAVVLTKNEEKNIEKCLKSLEFADEILIVDDYSEDKTQDKISVFVKTTTHKQNSNLKLKIYNRRLNGDFAEQRNFGLSKASNDWVLFIDADEIVDKELEREIQNLVESDINAYFIPRKDFFWGKELKFGEVRSVRNNGLVRLVKKNSGKWSGSVHEVFHTSEDNGKLKGFIDHYPHQTLNEFIHKINVYSSLRSEELFRRNKKTNLLQIITWPAGKFIYNYFINLGFLDGAAGFVYAFLMSFHSFLVRIKLYQLNIGSPK